MDEAKKIAVIVSTLNNPWFVVLGETARDRAAELGYEANQQKVVLSKVLSRQPRVLMLDEPTRGFDVSAKREIYGLIDRLKLEGIAIIVVSSELPELLGIADRIMVMCEGRKTGEFERTTANEEVLMRAAVPGAANVA